MKNMTYLIRVLLPFMIAASVLISCSKDSPEPDKGDDSSNTNTNTNTNTSIGGFCGDTICTFPFHITPTFLPSGYYDSGEQTTIFKLDSIEETPAYEGEGLRIVYTYHNNYWGAHFLNPALADPWAAAYKIKSTASKLTFKVRFDYSANVTFNAFGDVNYGKVELYQKTPVTPVWETITIPLLGQPTSFNAPLNIVIDFTTPPAAGTKIVVDIKDLQFEE